MKYSSPTYEISTVETIDVIAASSDIIIKESATGGANYLVDASKLF